jgi:hypothetical protein
MPSWALNSLEADLRARRAMLADPARAARLRAELADVRARVERFSSAAREWPYLLGDGFAAINPDIDYQLRGRVRAIVDEAETAINKSDPRKNTEPLQAWVRERLSAEADLARAGVSAPAPRTPRPRWPGRWTYPPHTGLPRYELSPGRNLSTSWRPARRHRPAASQSPRG